LRFVRVLQRVVGVVVCFADVCIRQTHFNTTFSVKRKFYVPPFRDSVTVPILPRLDNIPDDGDMLTLEVWTHDNAETINGIPRHILRDVWSNTGKDCYKRRQRLHCTDKLKLGGLVPYTEDDFVGVIYNNPDAEGLQLRTTHYPPLFIRDSKSTLVVCGYCRYVYQSQAEYAKCCGYEYFLMGLSGVKSQYLE